MKERADCPLEEKSFLQNISQVYCTSANQFRLVLNINFFIKILILFSLSSAKSRLYIPEDQLASCYLDIQALLLVLTLYQPDMMFQVPRSIINQGNSVFSLDACKCTHSTLIKTE